MAKYLDLHLESDQRLRTDLQAKEVAVNLKGKQMLGLQGSLKSILKFPIIWDLGNR